MGETDVEEEEEVEVKYPGEVWKTGLALIFQVNRRRNRSMSNIGKPIKNIFRNAFTCIFRICMTFFGYYLGSLGYFLVTS